jgi:hypothetical protein
MSEPITHPEGNVVPLRFKTKAAAVAQLNKIKDISAKIDGRVTMNLPAGTALYRVSQKFCKTGGYATERDRLVAEMQLEDMTFEAFCFMLKKEVDEEVVTDKLIGFIRACYDAGMTTYSRYIKNIVWETYGRIA